MSKVSVLIPAFNCDKYIDKCIQSVLSQSFSDFELLICDDFSEDKTLTIVESYKDKDSRINIFTNSSNLGKINTIEKLLSLCNGEYLTIIDSDDYISEDKLKVQVNFLDNNPEYSFVATSFKRISEEGIITSSELLNYDNQDIKNRILNSETMPICCGTVMCRTEYAKRIGGYNSFFQDCNGEDIYFVSRLLDFGLGKSIPDYLYFYRYREESLTRRVFITPKARHINEIVSFLFSQRLANNGNDSLNSLLPGLEDLIRFYELKYDKDKGLMKRKIAIDLAIKKNYLAAINSALAGFSFTSLISSIKTFIFIIIMIFFPRPILLFLKDLLNFKNISKKLEGDR